jgi:hypothetical protein
MAIKLQIQGIFAKIFGKKFQDLGGSFRAEVNMRRRQPCPPPNFANRSHKAVA